MSLSFPATDLGIAPVRLKIPSRSAESLPTPVGTTTFRLGPWLLESVVDEDELTSTYRAHAGNVVAGGLAKEATYAVRILRDELQSSATAIARLRQEAYVGRCIVHRHVASVLAAHVHRPPYYVVTPHRPALSVAKYLAHSGPLDVPMALWFARQTAEALEAVHRAGYIHGNVKPANLFFSFDGHTTLFDLTCARRIDGDPLFGEMAILGTPAYLAPEVLAGSKSDQRADLYALGITLFEMLAGRLPWTGSDLSKIAEAKRTGLLPNIRAFAPQIPNEVAALINCLCARQPLRRPQTAREAAHALLRLEITTLCARRWLA